MTAIHVRELLRLHSRCAFVLLSTGINTEDVAVVRKMVGTLEEVTFFTVHQVGDEVEAEVSMDYHGVDLYFSKGSARLVTSIICGLAW